MLWSSRLWHLPDCMVSWCRRQQYELSSLILLANNFGEEYNLWSFSYSFSALLFSMTVFKIINHVFWCSCYGVHRPQSLGCHLIFFSRNGCHQEIYCDCWHLFDVNVRENMTSYFHAPYMPWLWLVRHGADLDFFVVVFLCVMWLTLFNFP